MILNLHPCLSYLDGPLPSGEGQFSCFRPVSSPQLVFVINDLDDDETNSSHNASSDQNEDLEEREDNVSLESRK